jgi:hypothetical protein
MSITMSAIAVIGETPRRVMISQYENLDRYS